MDRIVAFAEWIRRRGGPRQPKLRKTRQHSGLQLFPLHFDIILDQAVPRVELSFLAINYLDRRIELRELRVDRFTCGGLPAIDIVRLAREADIEAASSVVVYCARPLADSEARAMVASTQALSSAGSVSFTARAVSRRKDIEYSAGAILIHGSIRRPSV